MSTKKPGLNLKKPAFNFKFGRAAKGQNFFSQLDRAGLEVASDRAYDIVASSIEHATAASLLYEARLIDKLKLDALRAAIERRLQKAKLRVRSVTV